MKYIIASLILCLAGCTATVPVKMNFPQVPEDLTQSCPDLQQVDPATKKLSDVVTVVSKNYEQYQECQVKVDTWVQWYNSQKKIFEEVK